MSVPEVTKKSTPQERTFPCTDQHVKIYALSIMSKFHFKAAFMSCWHMNSYIVTNQSMYTHLDLSILLHLIYCMYIIVYLWIFMLLICVSRNPPELTKLELNSWSLEPKLIPRPNLEGLLQANKNDMKDIIDIHIYIYTCFTFEFHWSIER